MTIYHAWIVPVMVAALSGCPAHHSEPPVELALELVTQTPVVRKGETAQFEVFLINAGDEPATVLLPGDGSMDGMRPPVARWQPALAPQPRCGNMNPLNFNEIVTLPPGERVELRWVRYRLMPEAGQHTIRLELEFDPATPWSGLPLGPHNADAMGRLERLARYAVVSNPVEVTVLD